MTVPVIFAIAGVVALFLGIWGGGLKAKEVEIPPPPPKARVFVGVLGVVFIGLSIWLTVVPLSGGLLGISASSTPTEGMMVEVTDTQIPGLTDTPVPPLPTEAVELLTIVGIWEGVTSGSNASGSISERLTTVLIPSGCQIGSACGSFQTEGACVYELTLKGIQDKVYTFDTLSVSGESFCIGGSVAENGLEITHRSDAEVYFYYKAADVMREGILVKQSE